MSDAPENAPETPTPSPAPEPSSIAPKEPRSLGNSHRVLAGLALVVALGGGGLAIANGPKDAGPTAKLTAPLEVRATLGAATIVGKSGEVTVDGAHPGSLGAGDTVRVPVGARVALGSAASGTSSPFVLDGRGELRVDGARAVHLLEGALVGDGNAGSVAVTTPKGPVLTSEGRFAVTLLEGGGLAVDVLRGSVAAGDGADRIVLAAGEQGVFRDGKVARAPLRADPALARLAFNETGPSADDPSRGLGELRARKAGAKAEGESQLTLASHAVDVALSGPFARTVVDEEFVNDSNDVLEGIYRFPLPADATLEGLAMEVDGKMMEGAWVARKRGRAILDGAISQAAPKPIVPRDEIIWVPGPWRDPAVLEWNHGGRFELRVYPIAAKSRKKIRITYTERVPLVHGERRYSYALPHATRGAVVPDDLRFAAHVTGADGAARATVATKDGDGFRYSANRTLPKEDPAITYKALGDDREVSAWGYRGSGAASASEPGFVGFALRPKLQEGKGGESPPESVVIVIDRGRAMTGARFARAKEVAARVVESLDRRSEVTVLLCDTACDGPKAGFLVPGPLAARDIEAFASNQEADGASDLVGAIREAASLPGAKGLRRRVVVLSSGVATAGYTTEAHAQNAVETALSSARARSGAGASLAPRVDLVPLGVDADRGFLRALAEGGAGTVVDAGGGGTGEIALSVLGALASPAAVDVKVSLPAGVVASHGVVPRIFRAGDEILVYGRATGDKVDGEVAIDGTLEGAAFSRKIPVFVPLSDRNGFLPRLWARAEIGALDAAAFDELAVKEAVMLSTRFAVPSRHTSLLVLENDTMYKAFGVDRTTREDAWSGLAAVDTAAAGELADAPEAEPTEEKAKRGEEGSRLAGALGASGAGQGYGNAGPSARASASDRDDYSAYSDSKAEAKVAPTKKPAPAPTSAPQTVPQAAAPRGALEVEMTRRPPPPPPPRFDDFERRQRLVPMRKTWKKALSFVDSVPVVKIDDVVSAQRAADGRDPDRTALTTLFGVLSRDGRLDGQEGLLVRWSAKDPLDADLLRSRANYLEARGKTREALRAMDGLLAAPMLTPKEYRAALADLVRAHDAVGDAHACAFKIALAEQPGTDAERIDARAAAARCEHDAGNGALADRLLDEDAKLREKVRSKYAATVTTPAIVGDVKISVRSDAGAVLPSAIDPKGKRISLLAGGKGVRGVLTTAGRSELAFSANDAGSYALEITGDAPNGTPVTVTVDVGGRTKSIPVVLRDGRARVAGVTLRWEDQLVPVNEWELPGEPLPIHRRPVYLE